MNPHIGIKRLTAFDRQRLVIRTVILTIGIFVQDEWPNDSFARFDDMVTSKSGKCIPLPASQSFLSYKNTVKIRTPVGVF
jgi:hypothetical protein